MCSVCQVGSLKTVLENGVQYVYYYQYAYVQGLLEHLNLAMLACQHASQFKLVARLALRILHSSVYYIEILITYLVYLVHIP